MIERLPSVLSPPVFADRAVKHAVAHAPGYQLVHHIPEWDDSGTTHPEEMVLITQSLKEVKQIMTNYVGIVRSDLRLERAVNRLEIIYRETEELYRKSKLSLRICQLRNLINVGYLVIKMAQARKESRGLHYNINYPKRLEVKS